MAFDSALLVSFSAIIWHSVWLKSFLNKRIRIGIHFDVCNKNWFRFQVCIEWCAPFKGDIQPFDRMHGWSLVDGGSHGWEGWPHRLGFCYDPFNRFVNFQSGVNVEWMIRRMIRRMYDPMNDQMNDPVLNQLTLGSKLSTQLCLTNSMGADSIDQIRFDLVDSTSLEAHSIS